MLSLGGEIARTGGNDDYPPSPNHNFPFIFKKLFPLNNYSPPDHCLHFHVRNILSSCSCHPWLLPVTSLRSPWQIQDFKNRGLCLFYYASCFLSRDSGSSWLLMISPMSLTKMMVMILQSQKKIRLVTIALLVVVLMLPLMVLRWIRKDPSFATPI